MKKVIFTLMALLCLDWQGIQLRAQSLVNRNASEETKGLKMYLDQTYGKQIISGQYWDTWANYIKTTTGRTPAILGLDFMDYTARRRQEGANPTDIEKAIDWTNNKNGIVTFSWHWDAPTDIYDLNYLEACRGTTGGNARWYKAFYTCATYFDLNDALNNPGGAKYNLLIRDIDVVANELKKLRDAKVPVLWRPLHEASGGWFWWGAKGAGPCKRLWALMYDRMTNFHQLDNLIWVWNCYGYEHGNPMDWFPGYNMVDIIAYDYPRSTSWSEYNSIHGGRGKIFSLAEVSGLPDPNNFNNARWSYFVTWGDFIQNNNTTDYIRRVYNDSRVVTLENLPDWKNFTKVPTSLALNKPVTVSSTEAGSTNIGTNVTDGSYATRWSSVYADPQWIQVDLQSMYAINRVVLNWEAASARDFRIETSTDGINWSVAASRTAQAAGARIDNLTGLTSRGRYVRIFGTARTSTWGYSLYEIEVYGTAITNDTTPVLPSLALNKPTTVSSTEAGGGNLAANATDGSSTTRWSSVYADPQWIQVDLQAFYTINRVVLNWETASARDYRVETSVDGITWSTAITRTNQALGARVDNLTGLSSVGRYVRIFGTARTSTWGYSLFEIEVYGTAAGAVNLTPVANAGTDITVTDADNSLSETVQLKGDASNDADGSIAAYAWRDATGTYTSTLANPSFTLPIGTHTFTLTVRDDKGASASDAVVVTVRARVSCTLLSLFGVPISTSLPSISSRSYSYVHVLGDGPNLRNVTAGTIQWDAQNNGLWQFAFNTNNGTPSWYVNLIPLTSHTFNRANPGCTLSRTGIAKLDGDYWVKMDGANFVMVARSGSHALYFSNSATAPVGCPQARSSSIEDMETDASSEYSAKPYVLPTSMEAGNLLTVQLPFDYSEATISIVSSSGKVMKTVQAAESTSIFIDQGFTSGLYFVKITSFDRQSTHKIIIQ